MLQLAEQFGEAEAHGRFERVPVVHRGPDRPRVGDGIGEPLDLADRRERFRWVDGIVDPVDPANAADPMNQRLELQVKACNQTN